jgi:elongation factor Ts
VSKNEQFKEFVGLCASILLEQRPNSVEELMDCKDSGGLTVAQILQDKILTIGENIVIRRFEILEGNLVSYVHGEGKIAVLVKFETDLYENEGFKSYAKDVAMQIAALYPTYISKSDVPSEDVEKEKVILIAQIKQDPQMASKPEQVIEKMVIGRLNKKFYQDACLTEQPFVKDAALTVGEYTNTTAKQMGGSISISKFLRYEKGEGIEKKETDFAAEVASMIK